jgi:hypothetical protein
MAKLISKTLLACGIAMAATTLCVPSSFAAEARKPVKAKAKPAKVKAAVEEDSLRPATPEDEPDVTDKNSVEFNCELGNKVTVYSNDVDKDSIALRWKKRLHRLTRVGTTTGANRFENRNFGLIWIGIPAKGMLLDSKLNRQLANECKNADQENPVVKAPAKPDLIAPVGKVIVEPAVPPAALAQPVIPSQAPVGAAPAAPAVTPGVAPQGTPASAPAGTPAPAPVKVPSMTPSSSPSVTPGVPAEVPAETPAPAVKN